MNPHPKVSIILTSYNHAKYLRDSIESVLKQTFSDFELIIWDDHSLDDSWDIINQYTDPRIIAYRNDEQKRAGWNINKAISEVFQGEYIAIHHSDDVWEPQKLEKQVAFLDENPPIGAVFNHVFVIGENGEPLDDESHFYYKIFEQPNRTRYEWLNYFFYHGNALCHPSVLIRKVCYDDCGLYRYGLAQTGDFDMWVRLCMKYEIHVLPEKLVRFRVRSNEMNTSGDRLDTNIRVQFELFQVLKNYRDIKTLDEITGIFPATKKYLRQEGIDIGFALGMAALDAETVHIVKLFGLELLFEALNDPDRARKINELYGFDHVDFIALTAKHDVFLVEPRTNLAAQVSELNTQVSTKNLELDAIYRSRAWRFVTMIRSVMRTFRCVQSFFNHIKTNGCKFEQSSKK